MVKRKSKQASKQASKARYYEDEARRVISFVDHHRAREPARFRGTLYLSNPEPIVN
jgi:hypothetical protein